MIFLFKKYINTFESPDPLQYVDFIAAQSSDFMVFDMNHEDRSQRTTEDAQDETIKKNAKEERKTNKNGLKHNQQKKEKIMK